MNKFKLFIFGSVNSAVAGLNLYGAYGHGGGVWNAAVGWACAFAALCILAEFAKGEDEDE